MSHLKADSKFQAVSPMATPNVNVVFDRAALEQAKYLVDEVPTECQWFHRVERVEDKDSITFYVYDMIVPDQEVSATFVESSDNEMVAMSDEIMARLGGEEKVLESDKLINEFNELTNTFSVWCHSHVNMTTGPSGTDKTEFADRIKNATEVGVVHPQIMFILNKRGDYTCHIADMESGWVFKNPNVVVSNADIDFSYINTAIKTKIRKKKPRHSVKRYNHKYSHAAVTSDGGASGWSAVRDSKGRFAKAGGTLQGNFPAAIQAAHMTHYLDGPISTMDGEDGSLMTDDCIHLEYVSEDDCKTILDLCAKIDSLAKKSDRDPLVHNLDMLVGQIIGWHSFYFLNCFLFESYFDASTLTFKELDVGNDLDVEAFRQNVHELPYDHKMLVEIMDDILMIKESPNVFDYQHAQMLEDYFELGE